jgi:tetratricopeptide (TPR) repeat protein
LEALNKYELAQLPRRVAGTHVNIGTIYDIQGDKIGAEKHWQRALAINSAIGNLEQEGIILLNYGVFHHHHNNFENAIESWQQANKIFNSIGMQNSFAVAVGNMGEVYLQICDYQNSYENLCRAGEIFAQLNNREEELDVLFLQGKFWFIVGAVDQLRKIIEQYEYYSLTLENLSERVRLNIDFLRLLLITIESKGFEDKKAVMNLIEKSKKEGENILATEMIFLLAEDLIGKKKFSEAKKLLDDIDLINYIEENIIFTAQREFLLGKIAQSTQDNKLKSPIEYFENALTLLEGQSINELTWKVLYTIAETYWERGNFHKAKKTRLYADELINMIGDNISNTKIRNAYFKRTDRKQALDKLNFMASQAQFNEYQKS